VADVATTGAGELIVRAALARGVVEALMAACSSTHSAGGARTCTYAVVADDAEFDSASSASADSDEATDDGPDTHAVLQRTLERFVRGSSCEPIRKTFMIDFLRQTHRLASTRTSGSSYSFASAAHPYRASGARSQAPRWRLRMRL
jgi:hypothetical protein